MTAAVEDRRTQILRTIDKFDKIGKDGVVDLLQKPASEFGAGLDPVSAGLIGLFLDTGGTTNEETLRNVRKFAVHATAVRSRLEMMALLEEQTVDASGTTAWDRLLAMPRRQDETWSGGGRPANIAWALDDLVASVAPQ